MDDEGLPLIDDSDHDGDRDGDRDGDDDDDECIPYFLLPQTSSMSKV